MRTICRFLILLVTLTFSAANLVLVYPQARFPPLDFLPTDLTQSPCGVPKPTKPFYTTLHIDQAYNVSWIVPKDSPNSTYRIKLMDSDGLTLEQLPFSVEEHSGTSSHQLIRFKTPCEQCMLLVEQVTSSGKIFQTCSDIHVTQGTGETPENEMCNQRGSKGPNMTSCQCESGFTGDQCQYYAHCETDDDCLNFGKCITQPDSLIRKRCFCSYGYFGQRCDQKFNSQNDHCFAYDEPVAADLPLYGMFNPRCYIRNDLSADDQLYARQVDNELEIILDFKTGSWVSLGWRPLELSTSCRLFPILEDTRGRSNDMDPISRRVFVARPVMPKSNGFTDAGLTASLHAMDCVDMMMASIRNGRMSIADAYSRDRSIPLEDYWYDGETSFSAAYGIEQDGRTVVMFRREMREFEPTDHPLGPGDIYLVWAKGEQGYQFGFNDKVRGIEVLKLSQTVNVTFEQPGRQPESTNEIAFGVRNVQASLDPMSISTPTPAPTSPTTPPPVFHYSTTTESSDTTTASSISPNLHSLLLILVIRLLL